MQTIHQEAIDEEKRLLSAVISRPEYVDTVTSLVKENDFFHAGHKIIFTEIVNLTRSGIPVSSVTLWKKIKREPSGLSQEYIETLSLTAPPMPELLEQHALSVRENAESRRLISVGESIQEAVMDGMTSEEVIHLTQKRLDSVMERTSTFQATKFADGLVEQLTEMQTGGSKHKRLPTTWPSVDRFLDGGLQLGQLDIIAGRTGMGKTSFGTSMMYNIAQSGIPSLMISIEMPRLQIIRKIIAGRCLIKEGNIANNDMSTEDWMKFETCAEELSDLKLFIDDKSRSLFEVIASIRSHVRRFDVKFVVVDYVQRIKVPTRDARYLEVGEVVDDLAELSKSLGINIMLLSQINRGVEGRTSKRPAISDLSESGKIEEAASRIFLLYRDDYYDYDSRDKGTAEVQVAKNRFGATGTARMAFVQDYTLFGELV